MQTYLHVLRQTKIVDVVFNPQIIRLLFSVRWMSSERKMQLLPSQYDYTLYKDQLVSIQLVPSQWSCRSDQSILPYY